MLYPNITVCPPEGANTALNYDQLLFENATLDGEIRNGMVNLVKNALDDAEFNEAMVRETEFHEVDKLKNWYKGCTYVSRPSVSRYGVHKYSIKTSAASGYLEMPWFGEWYGSCGEGGGWGSLPLMV